MFIPARVVFFWGDLVVKSHSPKPSLSGSTIFWWWSPPFLLAPKAADGYAFRSTVPLMNSGRAKLWKEIKWILRKKVDAPFMPSISIIWGTKSSSSFRGAMSTVRYQKRQKVSRLEPSAALLKANHSEIQCLLEKLFAFTNSLYLHTAIWVRVKNRAWIAPHWSVLWIGSAYVRCLIRTLS